MDDWGDKFWDIVLPQYHTCVPGSELGLQIPYSEQCFCNALCDISPGIGTCDSC